jgi:uncharacterized protein (TIGR04255 family)
MLRYLDFFDDDLNGSRSPQAFISDVLGIKAQLPDAIMSLSSSELRSLYLKFVIPIKMGELSLSIGDGKSNNRPGFVMDTSVTVTQKLPMELTELMKLFDNAHEVTHTAFRGLTKKIENEMQPQEAEPQ